jgi:hypothetical protein
MIGQRAEVDEIIQIFATLKHGVRNPKVVISEVGSAAVFFPGAVEFPDDLAPSIQAGAAQVPSEAVRRNSNPIFHFSTGLLVMRKTQNPASAPTALDDILVFNRLGVSIGSAGDVGKSDHVDQVAAGIGAGFGQRERSAVPERTVVNDQSEQCEIWIFGTAQDFRAIDASRRIDNVDVRESFQVNPAVANLDVPAEA